MASISNRSAFTQEGDLTLADVAEGGVVLVTNDPSTRRAAEAARRRRPLILWPIVTTSLPSVKDSHKPPDPRDSEAPAIQFGFDVDWPNINGKLRPRSWSSSSQGHWLLSRRPILRQYSGVEEGDEEDCRLRSWTSCCASRRLPVPSEPPFNWRGSGSSLLSFIPHGGGHHGRHHSFMQTRQK